MFKALFLLFILFPQLTFAAETIRRFLLVAGANSGGSERVELRYAISDAENFARVLEEMGGLQPDDRILLRQPSLEKFDQALETLRQKIAALDSESGQTEMLFYYSGHADEEGLLLGQERLSYQVLRRAMDAIPADVRIAVLDACASGAITRRKGGQQQPAFLRAACGSSARCGI